MVTRIVKWNTQTLVVQLMFSNNFNSMRLFGHVTGYLRLCNDMPELVLLKCFEVKPRVTDRCHLQVP